MTTHALVAPPVGTIYKLSRTRWYKQLREDEYWQVERRTDKTVWMRKLVTNTEGKPVPGMTRTDIPLKQCRVLFDASLCIHKGVYTDLYNDIYQPGQ
jgi:hypothetical protein